MRLFHFVFLSLLFVFSSASLTRAEESYADTVVYDFAGYTKMSGDAVKALFSGRTFWDRKQHDRFFFGQDGTFGQGYVSSQGAQPSGTIIAGQWRVDGDGAVCFAYQSVNGKAYPQAGAQECFDVYMGPDKYRPLPKYTDPLYIVPKGDDSKESVKYFWNRWIDGRVLLSPTFAQNFEKSMRYMQNMSSKFQAEAQRNAAPISQAKPLPATMQAYYKAVVGKVLYTPYHYLYFRPNGDYVFYQREKFDKARGDLVAFAKAAKTGRWIMHDNVHCWGLYTSSKSTCQYVARGQTLDHAFEGFVTHMDDGFTRLLNGNPVGIMSVEETGYAEGFSDVIR